MAAKPCSVVLHRLMNTQAQLQQAPRELLHREGLSRMRCCSRIAAVALPCEIAAGERRFYLWPFPHIRC